MPSSGGGVVVTGAAGFIGSHVVEAFLSRGQRVIAVDNFDPLYDESLKRANLHECRRHPNGSALTFVQADICDPQAMRQVFEQSQAGPPAGVVHLAARAGVRPSIADPVGYTRANVLGTATVLDAARAAGCSRMVVASSSSVYGNNEVVPFSEDQDASGPISPYAATKRAGELLAHSHWHLTRMPTACLRFFTVFGPRQRPDLAIGMFLRLVSLDEPVPMFGDGSSSRDYTYIDDIVSGVVAAYDRIESHGFRIWNLGGNEPVTLREMIATIARVVGRKAAIRACPARAGDVERTYADLTRSQTELGYEPRTGFTEGVKRQWEWMQAQGRT